MAALAEIRQVCRARPDGFQYMPKYKAGFWDGYISLMPTMSEFPTGLLDLVIRTLSAKNFKVELLHKAYPPYKVVSDKVLKDITLRDYEVEAANVLLEARHGVASMATNSGKTEVIAAIAWALSCEHVLVLEASKELLYQTAERLSKRLGKPVGGGIGIVGDGLWRPDKITVGMVQTLSKRLDLSFFEKNACIMVDECHHASSNTELDVLKSIPGSYRFGFSGTPLKQEVLQDLKLEAYTGPIRYTVSNEYLIVAGYSAEPTINMIEITSNDDLWEADYQEAYNKLIVENEDRNYAISQLLAENTDCITLVLVAMIKHGQLLESMIPGSIFVHGSDSIDKRKSVLKCMAESQSGVYIASPIFDEGVDVPAVDRIVIAGCGKSPVKLLQRLGRGMRRKEGHNSLTVIDFIDTGNQHLLNHAEARLDVYEQEGFKVVKPSFIVNKTSNG